MMPCMVTLHSASSFGFSTGEIRMGRPFSRYRRWVMTESDSVDTVTLTRKWFFVAAQSREQNIRSGWVV